MNRRFVFARRALDHLNSFVSTFVHAPHHMPPTSRLPRVAHHTSSIKLYQYNVHIACYPPVFHSRLRCVRSCFIKIRDLASHSARLNLSPYPDSLNSSP